MLYKYSFIVCFGFLSFLSFGQNQHQQIEQYPLPPKHDISTSVCSHYSPYSPPSFPQPQPKSILTNPIVYVQSIHNVIAKWDAGSVYRFDFGTSPGNDDIYNGHLLWNTDKHTIGHSYEELRKHAANQGTTFNQGDVFYLNLYTWGNVLDTSFMCQFNWEDLGNPMNDITITIETNYGLNGAPPFANWQANQMMAFYNLVNPIIKDIFGPPARNHNVNIVNDAYSTGTNTYYNGPNQVNTSYVTNADGDLDQPRLMIHELIHAYRDNVTLSSNDEWHYDPELSGFEEGMAEAVAIIVMDKFAELYPNFWNGEEFRIHWNQSRGMPFEWDYDFQNHTQLTTEDYFSSDIATGSHWLRYGMGAAAFRKMYIEDNDFFKNFNAAYYAALNADHTLLPSRNLLKNLITSVKPEVERTPTQEWIDQQHIFDCQIHEGKKVFMLSFTALNWNSFQHDNRIFCLETHEDGYEWRWNSSDQAGTTEVPDGDPNADWAWTHQLNNVSGNIQFIRDWSNSLHSVKTINTNGHWVTDQGGPYAGQALLGPNQGPNPYYVGATFTRDHEQDNCSAVPGCGKRAWAIGSQTLYTTTSSATTMWPLLTSQGGTIPNQRASLNMNESGLFRFNINFNDPQGGTITDSYYRLLGDNFISYTNKGLIGGIYTPTGNPVDGRMFIEHKNHGEEAELVLSNNSFKGNRTWTSNLEPLVHFQGGRPDRRYSDPGEVHAIYLNPDCSEKKIDFRTIGYGDGLDGTEMLLFNKDEFEDIIFTESPDIIIAEGDNFTLDVTSNFPDIFANDTRIDYQWIAPDGNVLTTDTNYQFNNALAADSGTYQMAIDFFGCPQFQLDVSVSIMTPLPIETIHFEATKQHQDVVLNWATSSELESDYFIIERSQDAVNWEYVTTVKAAESSNSILNYSARDHAPLIGLTYYRLMLKNMSGTMTEEGMDAVEFIPDFIITPNPASSFVQISGEGIEHATLSFYTSIGQRIAIPTSYQQSTIRLNTEHLKAGVYWVEINFSGYTKKQRFIIQ